MGTRAAVSAAALVEDGTESAGALVTESIASLVPGAGGVGAAASAAAGAWMAVLRAYEDGQAALQDAVERGLDSFSQNSASGIGAWAADALSAVITAAGLEPADTACRKPQVLNTRHVAEAGDDAVCVRFIEAKDAALAGSTSSTSFAGAVFGSALNGSDGASDDHIPIAQVELPFGGGRSISWAVPGSMEGSSSLLASALSALESAASSAMGDQSWQ